MVFLLMVKPQVKVSIHNLQPRPFFILVVVGPGGKEGQNKTHTQKCPPSHTLFSIQHIVTFVTSNNQKCLDALSESVGHDLHGTPLVTLNLPDPSSRRKKSGFWAHQNCFKMAAVLGQAALYTVRTLYFIAQLILHWLFQHYYSTEMHSKIVIGIFLFIFADAKFFYDLHFLRL